MNRELIKAVEVYGLLYPEDESLMGYRFTYGDVELLDIINKSEGRRIVFTELNGDDHYEWKYVVS